MLDPSLEHGDVLYDTIPNDGSEQESVINLQDDTRLTSASDGRKQNMALLHEASQTALRALKTHKNSAFEVRTRTCGVWN